jgi:hypothetical protein
MPLHDELARGRWSTFSISEQLANVGSEVERAIRAHETGRQDRFDRALDRALELFDFTAADHRWRGARRREILRAREEFCRLFFASDSPPGSKAGLIDYFLYFAIAARSTSKDRTGIREASALKESY